jgi:hypothetical protein
MGLGWSTPLSGLLEDHSADADTFWPALLSHAPVRASFIPCDPTVVNTIGIQRPDNFVNLGLLCAQYLRCMSEYVADRPIEEPNLGRLAWALNTFTTIVQVAARNPALNSLLSRLDPDFAARVFAPPPPEPPPEAPADQLELSIEQFQAAEGDNSPLQTEPPSPTPASVEAPSPEPVPAPKEAAPQQEPEFTKKRKKKAAATPPSVEADFSAPAAKKAKPPGVEPKGEP